ncbi:hypothetical protein [Bradyrhizobium sp. AUGA SZCCT0160]|uniref:hypothetical protein n=1 Tax=Bradyrhizobium sp. AUGA SZCCT0160 TaxID=2807662 RepID=UPI001BAB14A5|nr:hypothetical protein [Bradyrhizobium sp. AUGA SZCCT0160]MBR1193266.1 hypothetical protein [Bradyrhizobium sp. AUGA SZCCT0160]
MWNDSKAWMQEYWEGNRFTELRDFAKWWLDLARNLAVVAIVRAFSEKSDSKILAIFSTIVTLALVGYVYSYFAQFYAHTIDRYHSPSSSLLRRLAITIPALVLLLITINASTFGLIGIVKEISTLQK